MPASEPRHPPRLPSFQIFSPTDKIYLHACKNTSDQSKPAEALVLASTATEILQFANPACGYRRTSAFSNIQLQTIKFA